MADQEQKDQREQNFMRVVGDAGSDVYGAVVAMQDAVETADGAYVLCLGTEPKAGSAAPFIVQSYGSAQAIILLAGSMCGSILTRPQTLDRSARDIQKEFLTALGCACGPDVMHALAVQCEAVAEAMQRMPGSAARERRRRRRALK